MRLLLDTHVWIWSQESPELLGRAASAAVADEDNAISISSISSLEMACLGWSGRLTLACRLQNLVSQAVEAILADTIPLTHVI